MSEQQKAQSATEGIDAMTAFWRDLWARSTSAANSTGGMPGMPGAMPGAGMGADAFSGSFTPEVMRRMQSTFFDALAQYAEQSMRSPQFLESMKRSMDQALEFRRQMDGFLQTNMSSAFEAATGGANSEVMGAIRQSSQQLQATIAQLSERLTRVESAINGTSRGAKSQESTAGAAAKSRATNTARTTVNESRSPRSAASSTAPKSRGKRRAAASKR